LDEFGGVKQRSGFRRLGKALYRKSRSVIRNENDVGGQARNTLTLTVIKI